MPNDCPIYHLSQCIWLLGPHWHIKPNDPLFRAKVYAGTQSPTTALYIIYIWVWGSCWDMMPNNPLYLGQADITDQGPCIIYLWRHYKLDNRLWHHHPFPTSTAPPHLFSFVSRPMAIWRAIIGRVLRSPNAPDILRYTMNPAPRLTAFTQPLTQWWQRRTKMMRKILQTQTRITLQHWQILQSKKWEHSLEKLFGTVFEKKKAIHSKQIPQAWHTSHKGSTIRSKH